MREHKNIRGLERQRQRERKRSGGREREQGEDALVK